MDVAYHLAGLRRWLHLLRRHGRPDRLFYFNGGLGDQLLCSAVGRELQRRRRQKIWLFTQAADLFQDNRDFCATLPYDLALVPWARICGTPVRQLYYQELLPDEGRDAPLDEPIIASLCRRAGVDGRVDLRPHLPAVTSKPKPHRSRPRIAIQSSCLAARYPMANKQWPVASMQAVADRLLPHAEIVQLGSSGDPVIHGAADRRGMPLLESARELEACDLLVGLVGFLMHLARAVECPAVIVYGGREPPELTGYGCNTNLSARPACAPCWAYSRCDHDRSCLTAIPPEAVVASATECLQRPARRPLPHDTFVIAPRSNALQAA